MNWLIRHSFFALMTAVVPQMSLAADSYTLKSLIDRAVERNPELHALKLDGEAQKAKSAQAARWEDPSLDLSGEQKNETQGRTTFGKMMLSQNISRPGRLRAREDVALSDAKLSDVDRETSELELRGRVLKLIYSYRVASDKALHAKERYERFRTVGTYLRSRPFAAPQKRAEAAIVRSKLMVLQKELRELESNQHVAWNNLNLYLGLEREPKMIVPWYKAASKFALSDLARKAETANPELRRQTIRAQGKESELRLARLEAWPGFTLSAALALGSGASPETNYGLGISFPLPVFNGNQGHIQAAEALTSAEQARLKWIREKLTVTLKSALEHYQAASSSMLDLSPDKITPLERDMQEIDESFKKGQVDLITFLEADAQHFGSLNAILEAQTDFLSALGDLLLLVGEAPQPLEI